MISVRGAVRLYANCRWARPTDSPILLLGAAVSEVDALAVWLDREPEAEEDIRGDLGVRGGSA
ncbi:hypothetical protein [Streptomyces prasinus]|uniref:hypothetical protein n=1 Tax=Streptomyces prasinus TaxID=67345 RepID=UPI0033B88C17